MYGYKMQNVQNFTSRTAL